MHIQNIEGNNYKEIYLPHNINDFLGDVPLHTLSQTDRYYSTTQTKKLKEPTFPPGGPVQRWFPAHIIIDEWVLFNKQKENKQKKTLKKQRFPSGQRWFPAYIIIDGQILFNKQKQNKKLKEATFSFRSASSAMVPCIHYHGRTDTVQPKTKNKQKRH